MKTIRINKVLRELNISLDRAVEFLNEKGHVIESRPTAKISQKEYDFLLEEFQTDRTKREASNEVYEVKKKEKEAQIQEAIEKAQKHEKSNTIKTSTGLKGLKKVGKINLEDSQILKTGDNKIESEENLKKNSNKTEKINNETPDKISNENSPNKYETQYKKLSGLKSTGLKIDVDSLKTEEKKKDSESDQTKRRK